MTNKQIEEEFIRFCIEIVDSASCLIGNADLSNEKSYIREKGVVSNEFLKWATNQYNNYNNETIEDPEECKGIVYVESALDLIKFILENQLNNRKTGD